MKHFTAMGLPANAGLGISFDGLASLHLVDCLMTEMHPPAPHSSERPAGRDSRGPCLESDTPVERNDHDEAARGSIAPGQPGRRQPRPPGWANSHDPTPAPHAGLHENKAYAGRPAWVPPDMAYRTMAFYASVCYATPVPGALGRLHRVGDLSQTRDALEARPPQCLQQDPWRPAMQAPERIPRLPGPRSRRPAGKEVACHAPLT